MRDTGRLGTDLKRCKSAILMRVTKRKDRWSEVSLASEAPAPQLHRLLCPATTTPRRRVIVCASMSARAPVPRPAASGPQTFPKEQHRHPFPIPHAHDPRFTITGNRARGVLVLRAPPWMEIRVLFTDGDLTRRNS